MLTFQRIKFRLLLNAHLRRQAREIVRQYLKAVMNRIELLMQSVKFGSFIFFHWLLSSWQEAWAYPGCTKSGG